MNRLARLLRHFFRLQAAETRTRLRANPFAAVSLSGYTVPMTAALVPVLLPLAVKSGRATLRRLAAHKRGRKDFGDPPLPGIGFQVFDQRVVEFVRMWTYAFCDSTNQTSQDEVNVAVHKLRQELAEGLSRGETAQNLTRRVAKIFQDPARAHAIAQTEVSRATHGGQFLAAKESGLVRGKRWEASADACKLCQQMADRGEIPLDEPFAVLPGRGVYSVVMHPPIHPGDMCSMTEVLA